MGQGMKSAKIEHSLDVCGREVGDGICGQRAVMWAYLDEEVMLGYQATACFDHRNELLGMLTCVVNSDAPLGLDEDPR